MKCPHCTKEIFYEDTTISSYESSEAEFKKYGAPGYAIAHGFCPSCNELIVHLRYGNYKDTNAIGDAVETSSEEIIFPRFTARFIPKEVPKLYKKEFNEAVGVLNISPNASAAISRRLLQNLLREEFSIKYSSLAKEIDQFLELSEIPSYLSEAVDAVRNIGNYASHPTKDTNTGMIVEVENGEAEWLLDVLESLFDFVFVQPKLLEKRKSDLNAKLQSLGKPPMK